MIRFIVVLILSQISQYLLFNNSSWDIGLNELFGFDLKRFLFQVFFNYIDVPKLSSFRSSTPVEDETASLLSDSLRSRNEESKLGFNMCECGFEGISIKVAKRSSNQVEDEALEEQVTKRTIFEGGRQKSI